MKFTLTRGQIRAMLTLAATKDVRFYLNGLHITQDARGTMIEATDGHALGVLRVDSIPQAPCSAILSRDNLKPLAGTKKESGQVIEFSIDNEFVTASVNGTVSTFRVVDGRFPDTLRVVPTNESLQINPIEVSQIDPELLVRFVECSRELGMKGGIAVRPRGQSSALVSLGIDDFVGVVMPMRMETPETVPAWVHMPAKQETQAPELVS